MDSNYITYDACRQIENFYDYLEKSNATHIASFRLWLETFHKNNCSKTLPLENFLNKYTTKYSLEFLENSGSLFDEVLRHAQMDLWKYASLHKNKNICDQLEEHAKSQKTVLSYVIENQHYWG